MDEMRDRAQRIRTEEAGVEGGVWARGRWGGLEFQQDDIKTRERKRGDRQGHGEPRRETRRTRGG